MTDIYALVCYVERHTVLSLSLIRPPYLPRNCGHIKEVAAVEREKKVLTFIVVVQRFTATLERVASVGSDH